MEDQSFSSFEDVTLNKFLESLKQQANSSLLTIKVPEFHGNVGEDVRAFKAATFTFDMEMKCLTIQNSNGLPRFGQNLT